ncbi:DNA glycosylase [Spinellus fusiger]|nr:DNA glycosylase [Spinellus fusiger]
MIHLRRSTRIKPSSVPAKVHSLVKTEDTSTIKNESIKEEAEDIRPLPKARNKRVKEASMALDTSKSTHTQKKVKQEELNSNEPPKNWKIVLDKIQAFRKDNLAPVDTMGCERLAENTADPITSRFQTLVALMLSAQTKDTVTSVVVKSLQTTLPGGLGLQSILNIDEQELDYRIRAVGFHTKKAMYIKKTAEIIRDKFNGDIPNTIEDLVTLPGVGPKMGYLTLQVAWNINSGIGVDVHVHRISNRLGWCNTSTKLPEDTRKALESWLPHEHWKEINPTLVGFGQSLCLPRGPKCGACPVQKLCPSSQVKPKEASIKKEKRVKEEKDQLPVIIPNTSDSTSIKKEELDW